MENIGPRFSWTNEAKELTVKKKKNPHVRMKTDVQGTSGNMWATIHSEYPTRKKNTEVS